MAVQLRASSFSRRHDVFLSFRGVDTRHGFTGHLYKKLLEKGIKTFIDDELTEGEEISEALLLAIEQSKLSLIVFSENYAFSKWCLDELVHILKCRRSSMNHMVHPIFYKVDPSDVRRQKGTYGKALAKHESRCGKDKLLRWREALTEAANLSGWTFRGYEYEFIERIVAKVSAQVKEPTYLDAAKSLVGIQSRVQNMLEMLDVGGSDVRMVGIWGSGGIGKTTMAKAVYNEIAREFDGCCFLANVRTRSEQQGGLINLQNTILSEILGNKDLKVTSVDQGINILPRRLRNKRILLILDDVNKREQLETLARAPHWFGSGSRVIITTRDKRLLDVHDVNLICKAKELDDHESSVLFSSNVFKNKRNPDDDEKLLINTLVSYARGLPLALEVLGSHLYGRPVPDWQAMLDGFKRDLPKDIQEILKVSYDGLEETEKEVFLDIACFFNGWKINGVIQILESCDRNNPKHCIVVLEEKALMNVDYCGRICMHDMVEKMGKKIARQQSPNPGERSRLWHHKDVQDILTQNAGTSKIEGIIVKMHTTDVIHLHPKCFKKMENLKIFINVNGRFVGKVDYYPNQLRVLDWPECPLQSWPSDFDMKKMVHLNMSNSRISNLGKGFKSMQNLTLLNLRRCGFLKKFPDVTGCPNLETLDLSICINLVEVHPSVGFLEKLVELNFYGCKNLVKLPGKVNWRSLQQLNLNYCGRLESFPEIMGEMKYLTYLGLSFNAIKALPSSIRYVTNLERLSLEDESQKLKAVELLECPNLVTLPNKKVSHDDGHSLSGCSSLMDNLALRLSNLDILATLDCASTLQSLNLSFMDLVVLPECIKEFVNLRRLVLMSCRRLKEIPELPPKIEWLDVRYCVSLERISKLSNILERKESQMIKMMDLTECRRLCGNLVNEEENKLDADLFCRLLCSQLSEFTIIFPVSRIGVPKWFSCQMDFKRHKGFEFWIEALPNFTWDNTGLALCVVAGVQGCRYFDCYIYIDQVRLSFRIPQGVDFENVWVHYVPFHEMLPPDYRRPLPPFTFRVLIYQHDFDRQNLKICGVHIVMPPNEDVCMQLIRQENLHSRFSDDETFKEDNWEKYGPKQGECSAHT